MDDRLVIPELMRAMKMCSLHYGHPGRDSMLAMIEDIWWPHMYREVIDQPCLRKQCLQSGKNLKCILRQKQKRKIAEVKQQNEVVLLEFTVPFQTPRKEKIMLVAIEHFSSSPDPNFLQRPTTKK